MTVAEAFTIDIYSVAYFDNIDDTRLIIDRVDDPIVALADTIEVRPASELFSPRYLWLSCERFNPLNQSR